MRYRQIGKLVKIGTLGRTYGREGGVKFFPDESVMQDILDTGALFLDINGSKVPFLIAGLEMHGDLVVFLDGIETPEQALPFVSAEVFLPEEDLTDLPDHSSDLFYTFLEGYQALLQNGDLVGEIREVREFPQQEMAVLHRGEREILIPLADTFIREIDREKRLIVFTLPDGLLEL